MAVALTILAAGKGTRMQSDLPKVLHQIAGAPMVVHAMRAGAALEPERTVIVTGHGAEHVETAALAYDPEVAFANQAEQLGTGHAVAQAANALDGFDGDVIVLYGDTPFIRPETLQAMIEARANADVVVLGFEAADPARYGRLVTDGDVLKRIVEFKDASDEERAITLCNSGVMCANSSAMMDLVAAIGNENASGEYYLTDIVALAAEKGMTAAVVRCSESETLGVDSRPALARAEGIFQANKRAEMIENGVQMMAPDTVFFAFDTEVGRDTVIEPNVVFAGGVTVESGAMIRAFSHLEGCHVSRDAVVGPYARLRPGAELAEGAKVGNFSEIKNAQIGEGAKVNHLSYIGDATLGAKVNVGAGTITCNYDGVFKHQTVIGDNAFIGSNTMLVAPVTVGADALTGSGSVITQDVPDEALAVGRARQVNKAGLAKRLMDSLRARKAKGE